MSSIPEPQPPQDPQPQPAAPQQPVADPSSLFGDPESDAMAREMFKGLGHRHSVKADGWSEWAKFQTLAASKAAADGVANLGFGLWKGAAGVGAGTASMLAGEGWMKGWDYAVEDVRNELRKTWGSEDPGALDIMSTFWNGGRPMSVDNFNPQTGTIEKMSVGESGDQLIQNRLGNMAALGQTVGALTAFATGPGAAVGRVGAGISRIATARIDSAIAKSLAKGVKGLEEFATIGREGGKAWGRGIGVQAGDEVARTAFGEALKRGDGLAVLGKLPGWKEQATRWEQMLRLGGRGMTEAMDLTAANIAQSYLLEKDQDRLHGVYAAAMTSWLAGPLSRAGQFLGSKILTSGVMRDPATTKQLGDIYAQMVNGTMGVKAADKAIEALIPTRGRKLLANSLSAAIEGTGFLAISPTREGSPSAWDLWKSWQAGDDDAGVALVAMWTGSVVGIAATKYAVPHDLAPMFKSLRPDLNTLKIHMEAEGFRRMTDAENEARKRDVEQEAAGGERRDDVPSDAAEREAFIQSNRPKYTDRAMEEKATGQDLTGTGIGAEVKLPAGYQIDPMSIAVQATEMMYGWAEPHTSGVLRAGWEPVFMPGPGGDVQLRFDRDFHATLSQGESAEPALTLNADTYEALKSIGREPDAPALGHPNFRRVAAGKTAQVMDDLAMLGWTRQMQGTLAFERLGMKEVSPGVWLNEETGRWHKIRLDGKSVSMMPQDDSWSAPQDLQVVGGFGEAEFTNDGIYALQKALTAKVAIAPDNAVDSIISQALTLAQHSDSKGARELRQFMELMSPAELRGMLEKGNDEWLAYILGSLATGNNNAKHAAGEFMSDRAVADREIDANLRRQHAEKQARLEDDQAAREQFVVALEESIDTVPNDKIGKARMGSGVAEAFRRMVPAIDDPKQARTGLSVVGRIARREGPSGSGVLGHTQVTAGELREIAKTWSERVSLHRQTPYEDSPEARRQEQDISLVDDWLSRTARDLGLAPIGETGRGVAIDLPAAPPFDSAPNDGPNPEQGPPSASQPPPPPPGGDSAGPTAPPAPQNGVNVGPAGSRQPATPSARPAAAESPSAPASTRPQGHQSSQEAKPAAKPTPRQEAKAIEAAAQEGFSVILNKDGTYTVKETKDAPEKDLGAIGARYDENLRQWVVDDFNSINQLVERAAKARRERDAAAADVGPADGGSGGPGRRDLGMPSPVGDPVQDPPGSRIVTARREWTPKPDVSVIPEALAKHLRPHQLDATAAAWHAMHRDDRGFLLASGTGAGKTRSILAMAKMHMDAEKRPVVIVAPNEVLGKPFANSDKVSGSYADDAKELGVAYKLTKGGHPLVPGKLYFTTYQHAHNIAVDKDTVLVFDEAHQLKNGLANRSQRGLIGLDMIDKAHSVLFATATPADQPSHLPYLERISLLQGRPVKEALDELGFYEQAKLDLKTKEVIGHVWQAKPGLTEVDVAHSIDKLFAALTADGKAIKHEISMQGIAVQVHKVQLPSEAIGVMDDIIKAWGGDNAGRLVKAQQMMNLRRQQEPFKVPATVELIQDAVGRGRKVVVFVQRVNAAEAALPIKKHNPETGEMETVGKTVIAASDGTVKLLRNELQKLGYTKDDIAELHGDSEESAGKAMARFQKGKAKVVLATIESGGTGINLDDAVGDAPRTLIMMTPPWSSVENVQAIGRVWRLSTKSVPEMSYVLADSKIDNEGMAIIERKMRMLGAVVGGQVNRMSAGGAKVAEGETAILDAPARPAAEKAPTPAPEAPSQAPEAPSSAPESPVIKVLDEPKKRAPFEDRIPQTFDDAAVTPKEAAANVLADESGPATGASEEITILSQNIKGLTAERDLAESRLRDMAKLPLEQRATKGTAAAMAELEKKVARLGRTIRGLDRRLQLSIRASGRSEAQNEAIRAAMRDLRRKPESVLQWVAKRGGIKVDLVDGKRAWPKGWPGEATPEEMNRRVGGRPLYTSSGTPWERLVTSAIEDGFFERSQTTDGRTDNVDAASVLQEILSGGDSIYSANDTRVLVEMQREEAKQEAARAKEQKKTDQARRRKQRLIEEAAKKRGVAVRIGEAASEQVSTKDAQRMAAAAETLPEVTDADLGRAEAWLQGEMGAIQEGVPSTLTAADVTAIDKLPPKQRVAAVNEHVLQAEAEKLRRRGLDDDADVIENVLLTASSEQIAERARKIAADSAEEGLAFSGPGISPKTQKAVVGFVMQHGKRALEWALTDRLEVLKSVAPGKFTKGMDEIRTRTKQGIGQAQTLFADAEGVLRRMKSKAMSMVVVNDTPMARWQALAEGRIDPSGDQERIAAKAMRDTGLYLWNLAKEAGVRRAEWDPVAEDWRFKPITDRDQFVMPRTHGEDWDAFMGTSANRNRLWQWLIDHNDLKIAERHPETGRVLMNDGEVVLRQMTPADMEARFTKRPDRNIDSAEEQAAFEFVRHIKNFPAMFEGHRLLQINPFEAFRRLIHEQSGRAATVKVWGQDFGKKTREAIEHAEGIKLPPGAEAVLREYQSQLNNAGSVSRNKHLQQMAEDLLVTIQGTNPQKLHPALKALQPLESLARASMTWKSGLHDVPAPFIQGAAYAGWRRMMKAVWNVATSPREFRVQTERVGALFRNMGMRDPLEADAPHQKLADLISAPGNFTERRKTVAFDAMAREMLADWGRGRVTGNDRDVLAEMLRFDSADQASLLAGKAPELLQTRFRQEFVKLTTGRRTKVDGSEFLASPNLQQVVRFGNWISGRMVEIGRNMRGMGPDRTPAQRWRAMKRMSILTGGYALAGTIITTPLAYLLADLFKGENGWKRWLDELSYAPGQMVANALAGQVAGGPTAQMWSAVKDPSNAKTVANLVAPVGMGWSLLTKIHQALQQSSATSPGDLLESAWHVGWAATGQAAAEAGIIPSDAKNLAALVQGWTLGQDGNQASDSKMVNAFKRLEGIQDPQFARNKQPAFYDALGDIRRAIGRHPGDTRAALADASQAIATALQLAPEESLSQAIRSMQHLDGISPEVRAKMMEYSDDERMTRIYAHDMAVRELAAAVGRMHGEPTTPFEESLDVAKKQARLGAGDAWNRLVDQAVDDAELAFEGGSAPPADLRLLAEAMASFPGTLSWLSEKQRRSLSRPMDRAVRARILQTILTRQARERANTKRKGDLRR